jgi:flagellar hook-associated protein FlgK
MAEDVTMSAEQAKVLQGAYNLMNKLYSGKEAMSFKKLVKSEGFAVPELDTIESVTKPYDEKLTAYEKKFKDLEERLAKKDADELDAKELTKLESDINKYKKEFGVTDEGVKKVVERLKETKSADVEAAFAWMVSKEPKAQPTKTSHNFSQSKFDGKNLAKGGDTENVEKLLNGKMSQDDYFDNVVNDVLNNPLDQLELGGKN